MTQIIVGTGKAGFCNQGVIDEVWYSILRDEYQGEFFWKRK